MSWFRQACRLVPRAMTAAAIVASVSWAQAQQGNAGPAREAYDRGSAAYRKGDYGLAAHEYARADELMPNDTALQAGLEAAVLSDEVELGMELLERARRGEAGKRLTAAIKAARKKFQGRAGRIRVSCGEAPCTASVDGALIEPRATRWVRVGWRKVAIDIGQVHEEQTVEVKAEQLAEVVASSRRSQDNPTAVEAAAVPATATADAVPAAPVPVATTEPEATVSQPDAVERAERGGLAPRWFWIGAAVTGVLGGAAGYFAVQSSGKYSDFRRQDCANSYSQECLDLAEEGKAYDLDTGLLATTAALAGIGTAVIGIWFVRWNDAPNAGHAALGLTPGRAHLRLTF